MLNAFVPSIQHSAFGIQHCTRRSAAAAGTNAVVTIEEQERAQRVWWYLLFVGLVLLGLETVLSNRMGHVRV